MNVSQKLPKIQFLCKLTRLVFFFFFFFFNDEFNGSLTRNYRANIQGVPYETNQTTQFNQTLERVKLSFGD